MSGVKNMFLIFLCHVGNVLNAMFPSMHHAFLSYFLSSLVDLRWLATKAWRLEVELTWLCLHSFLICFML